MSTISFFFFAHFLSVQCRVRVCGLDRRMDYLLKWDILLNNLRPRTVVLFLVELLRLHQLVVLSTQSDELLVCASFGHLALKGKQLIFDLWRQRRDPSYIRRATCNYIFQEMTAAVELNPPSFSYI